MRYVIKPGDTLGIIAKEFLGDPMRYKDIAFASGIRNPNVLEVGQVIDIPVDIDLTFTAEQLRPISVYISDDEREEVTKILNMELARNGIDEPLEIAHFLSQVSHESAGFRCRSENLNYSAKALGLLFKKYFQTETECARHARKPEEIANVIYANRMGNGSVESGDGWFFRGGGYIQLTGRDNYLQCGKDIGMDLVSNPDIVRANRRIALKSAIWFWNEHKLGVYALQDDLNTITKKINGGYHGLESRQRRLDVVKVVLGIS